jgi:hypothetical protein
MVPSPDMPGGETLAGKCVKPPRHLAWGNTLLGYEKRLTAASREPSSTAGAACEALADAGNSASQCNLDNRA